MDLDNRIALVTGSARRVGREIALNLAEAGCHVVVHYRSSKADAKETAARIEAKGRRCSLVSADLADRDGPQRVVDHALDAFGAIDILVNNAAAFPSTTINEINRDNFLASLDVNLVAPVLLAVAAWPCMQQAGRGKIINILDISAERPWSNYIAYCAAKAGLLNATRSLAVAMAPTVQVNGVSPGVAVFPEDRTEAEKEAILARVPLRTGGSPEEIAKAVRFLARDADYITGQVIAVDGGRSIAW